MTVRALLAFGALLALAVPAQTQSAGDLRLADGDGAADGRLEIFHDDEWGLVCDDGFGAEEAAVACRQLGYIGFFDFEVEVVASSLIPVWLDDVVCTGSETRLIDCQHATLGEHNCTYIEAVDVTCNPNLIGAPPVDNTPATGQIDIVGTRKEDYTLLAHFREVTDAEGVQGLDLASPYVHPWLRPYPFSVQWIANAGGSDREIDGATNLLYQLTSAEAGKRIKVRVSFTDDRGFAETITSELTAAIAAGPATAASEGDLRLIDGDGVIFGRLEVYHAGRWGTVCDDGFDEQAAAVACSEFGYSGVAQNYPSFFDGFNNGNPRPGYFVPGPGYPIWLDDLRCTGSETRLVDCAHRSFGSNNCGRTENVILGCVPVVTPVFTIPTAFSVGENETLARRLTVTSEAGVHYTIEGGADRALFAIDGESRELRFTSGRDFESPADVVSADPSNAAGNNEYVVVVQARSGTHAKQRTAQQTLVVTVTDVDEPPPAPVAVTVAFAPPTSLRVSWEAADNSGRPAITDYDVRYRVAGSDSFSDAGHVGTGLSTTLTELAANTTYEVQVRASNDEGAGPWSPAVRWTTGANQVPSGAPTIAGTARVGETLTADPSSIVDADGLESPSFRYQWLADEAAIAGATGARYTLTAVEQGKRITVRVTFTDDAGTEETLTSAATEAVVGADTQLAGDLRLRAGDSASSGRLEVYLRGAWGTVCDRGFGEEEGAVACRQLGYAGLDEIASFGRARTGPMWIADVVCTGSESRLIDCRYTTDHNCTYREEVGISCRTVVNQVPGGAPAITGTAQVGQTLTADTSSIVDGDGPESPSFRYQWLADEAAIAGATGATYTLTAAEQGKVIRVRVSYTDGGGTEETLTSAATAAVAAADTQQEPKVEVLVFFGAERYTAVEGGAAEVTVRLSEDPEREVTITLTATPGGGAAAADYTVPGQVSFGSGETLQRITVTATDDAVDDDGETVAVGFGELPPGVTATAPRTATVGITDDDTAGVAVSAGALSVPEGGRGSYTVALESEPEGTVTVRVIVAAGTDVTVSPQRLTFTADTGAIRKR